VSICKSNAQIKNSDNTYLTASFPGQLCYTGNRKVTNFDFNETRNDEDINGKSWTLYKIICILLQTDNHASTSSLNFHRPDALPDTQPNTLKNEQVIQGTFK